MNTFIDLAFTYDIQLSNITWELDFNGANKDEPDDNNPDNGLPNPFDHSRGEE